MIVVSELLENASLFGIEALERFGVREELDWRFTAVFAATSLEQLLKAALAERNVLLLVDTENAMAALLGAKSDRIRTIGASKTVERYGWLNVRFRPLIPDLKALQEVRNGVVHLAIEPPETFSKAMAAYLRAVELVLDELGESEDGFWGSPELSTVVADLRSVRVRTIQEDVDRRIAIAVALFGSKYAGLSEDERIGAVTAAETSPSVSMSDVHFQLDCPACGSLGLIAGDVDVVWEVEDLGWGGYMQLLPSLFLCRVCELYLNDQEEIEFGIGDIDLPDSINPHDFSEPPSLEEIPGFSLEDLHPYPFGH